MASGRYCFHVSNISCVVCKLKITHLVSDFKSYKKTSRVVTQALGKISELLVRVGDVQCFMTFMIMDINNYDC
jgi:uncharacterized membrane protein